MLKKFPPRSLDMLEAQRDVLLQYARRSPVSSTSLLQTGCAVSAAFCLLEGAHARR